MDNKDKKLEILQGHVMDLKITALLLMCYIWTKVLDLNESEFVPDYVPISSLITNVNPPITMLNDFHPLTEHQSGQSINQSFKLLDMTRQLFL